MKIVPCMTPGYTHFDTSPRKSEKIAGLSSAVSVFFSLHDARVPWEPLGPPGIARAVPSTGTALAKAEGNRLFKVQR